MKFTLTFCGGSRDGEQLSLSTTDKLRIGRRPSSEIAFDPRHDLDVSARHAELDVTEGVVEIRDLGSSNGTYLEGVRIERARIRSGQQIFFGEHGIGLRIQFEPDANEQKEHAAAPMGPRTVRRMIDHALDQARGSTGKIGRSTAFLSSMVNQAVRRSTRRFRLTASLVIGVLLLIIAALLGLRYRERQHAEDDSQRLRKQVAQLLQSLHAAKSDADRQTIAASLQSLNRKLAQGDTSLGKRIVVGNLRAVYLMAATKSGHQRGFCTAFAIGQRTLATNAHCVVALGRLKAAGAKPFVVMNRNPRLRLDIVQSEHHPAYYPGIKTIGADVGLLRVSQDLPALAHFASDRDLHRLESGDVMFTYGFPGRLAEVASPNATLVRGVIGRVTRLDGRLGDASQNVLIQHSAFTSGGTSGSPIFDERGRVIAVNAGGYVEPGSMRVVDPRTGRTGQFRVAQKLAGYNFGIRADVIQALVQDIGW